MVSSATQMCPEQQFVGESAFARELRGKLLRIATLPGPLLITGETGTGKGLVANWLHELRGTKGKITKIACPNIPEALFESELFGTKRGAYTGAVENGGLVKGNPENTIFFDEIGEIPLTAQVKLLTFFDGSFRSLGKDFSVAMKSFIIAATNLNLQDRVFKEVFRKDLFYRLRKLYLYIPPLRERPKDVLPLIRHFMGQMNPDVQLKEDTESVILLQQYAWPGNARDVEGMVQNILLANDTGIVTTRELIQYLAANTPASYSDLAMECGLFPSGITSMKALEDRLIQNAMERTGGNISMAARLLGITRNAMRYKLGHLAS